MRSILNREPASFEELSKKYGKAEAAQFLRNLIKAIPYKIHTILTDNGIQFTNRKVDKYAWAHIFDRVCHEHQIDHRLTKVNHPWTNGQVERMNRTLKEATVKRYYYDKSKMSPVILSNQAFVEGSRKGERVF